ncbi:hypothetical protein JVU11DRAFT_2236 [Chiua virens]|nr:hypothetical protein JVU11DRAFT_2236 [Chiua virens]
MHHALQVTEILLNIVSHWNAPSGCNTSDLIVWQPLERSDLAALARTCRLFKEPTLDVLWSALDDLHPVTIQFRRICCRLFDYGPSEQTEWATLRSYTCRIRSVYDFDIRFFWCNADPRHTIDVPLLPNLRHLRYLYRGDDPAFLLHIPLPSLSSLTYVFNWCGHKNPAPFKDYLRSFPGKSPTGRLQRLTIHMDEPEVVIDPLVSDFVCRWPDPRIVSCPLVTLNINAFKHLACVSDVTHLRFTLDAALPDLISPIDTLCFSKLQELELHSKSLIPVSKLLSCVQLSTVTDLIVRFMDIPSKRNVSFFLEVVELDPEMHRFAIGSDDVLVSDDLRPLMALKNLRRFDFHLQWEVVLTDDDLLELSWRWRQTSGGITPDGILRLLQTCPSIKELALLVDTRSSVEACLSLRPPLDGFGLKLSHTLFIDIANFTIEEASVPAMVAFFVHLTYLIPSGTVLSLRAWNSILILEMWDNPNCWRDVFRQTEEAVEQSGRRISFDMW